jgi:ribosomal protein S18 acetylase RimI-like enzyme
MSRQDERAVESGAETRMKVVCHQAVPADVPTLSALLAELMRYLGVTPPDPERSAASLEQAIRSDAQTYLLASGPDGNPAGACGLLLRWDPWTGEGACEVHDLVVTATLRRHGVGRALLEAAAGLARERGCTRLYVLTDVWAEAGPAFYRRLGFADKPALYFEKAL